MNGLDVPLAVEAAGGTTNVPPGEVRTARVPVGSQRLRAVAPDGSVVEDLGVEVPRWTDLVVYNPLGAAPLFAEPVVYLAEGKPEPATPPATALYAGRPFVARDDVAYPFRVAPPTVEMSSGQDQVIRWRADQMQGGWRASLEALGWEGRLGEAAGLAARMAKASPALAEAHLQHILLANWARGPEAGLAAAREAAAALPAEVDVQRQLAYFLQATGRREEALRVFRERAAREPDSALAGYLRARLEPQRVALPAFEALAHRFPGDANVHRGLAWAYLSAGRSAEALREWKALARLDPEAAEALVAWQASALVKEGRPGEAMAKVAERARSGKWDAAILYGQLARTAPRPPRPPGFYLDEIAKELPAPWLAAALRARAAAVLGTEPPPAAALDEIPDARTRESSRILAATAADPGRALTLAAKAPADALAQLPRGVAATLAGEAARRGDGKLAHRIATAAVTASASEAELLAFVRGEAPESLEDEDPEIRAGLPLGRARAAQAAGRDAEAIYRAARAADVLRGCVSVALARWPKPD
jgi:hypothetical protein